MVGTIVIQATDTFIEIDARQGRAPVTRTVVETGRDPASHNDVADDLTILLQNDVDIRRHVDDLPTDEETLGWNKDKMRAVYGGRMFWKREGPDLYLVYREDIITVNWNGEKYVPTVRMA